VEINKIYSDTILIGEQVILEPLKYNHIPDLLEAAMENPAIYKWTYVPNTMDLMTDYVLQALKEYQLGTAYPFVIMGKQDKQIKGCTRYFNIEKWKWPQGHPLHRNALFDTCEIGFTWLRESAIRTGVNTETKMLLLTYLFEHIKAIRVCFTTDSKNKQSQNAIERLGAHFEGVLRADRMLLGYRDSYRYSILHTEWGEIKHKIEHLLNR